MVIIPNLGMSNLGELGDRLYNVFGGKLGVLGHM